MKQIKTSATPVERTSYEFLLDDVVIRATRPKDLVLGRAAAIFDDKYATDQMLARTAFDFLESSLDADSWTHILDRLRDRDDHFDSEELGDVFEALFDLIKEGDAGNEQTPVNREARRARAATAPKG